MVLKFRWITELTATRFVIDFVKSFLDYGCQKSSAALTYITLFAIVPLMTVMYSIFSLVPEFNGVADQLQDFIFSHLIPETSKEVQGYLSRFSSKARSLTGFGIGMLIVTSYLMLVNIEKTFNAIWGVKKRRKGLSSILRYWAILSVGPLLLGTGFAMSTYLLSIRFMVTDFDSFGVTNLLYRGLPLLFTSIAFTLLFVAVPNCKVPIRFAFIGGVTTAILFEILKNLFGSIVAGSDIHVVYGAFAVFPLFLLWVNLAWKVVLAGAILVRTLAEKSFTDQHEGRCDMVMALKCLALFQKSNSTGQIVSDSDCYKAGLGVVAWQGLREQLEGEQWIARTSDGGYVLCRNLKGLTLWDLLGLLELTLHKLNSGPGHHYNASWLPPYLQLKEQAIKGLREPFERTIEDLLEGNKSP